MLDCSEEINEDDERLFHFLVSLPVAGDQISPDAIRVSGEKLTSREMKEDDVGRMCDILNSPIMTSMLSNCSINIHVPRTLRYGIYLDVDIKYISSLPTVPSASTIADLESTLRDAAGVFIEKYVEELLKIHIQSTKSGFRPSSPPTSIRALFASRPSLGSPIRVRGTSTERKYGCHVYMGDIYAFDSDHLSAFDMVVESIRREVNAILAERASEEECEGSEVSEVNEECEVSAAIRRPDHANNGNLREMIESIEDTFHIPLQSIPGIFDRQINMSRNILIAGCRKRGGTVTYLPSSYLDFKIVRGKRRFPKVTFEKVTPMTGSTWPAVRFFPSLNRKFISTLFLDVESRIGGKRIEMPDIEEYSRDESSDGMEAWETLIKEAENCKKNVHQVLRLLSLIPFDELCSEEGHTLRLRCTNAVVHSLHDGSSDMNMWIARVLEGFLNRGSPPEGKDWNKKDVISEKIFEALQSGNRVGGLAGLRKIASEFDEDAVDMIESCRMTDNLLSLLEDLHANDMGSIPHKVLADVIYVVIGENYHCVVSGGGREGNVWYRFGEKDPYGVTYRKWTKVPDIHVRLASDIETRVHPALDDVIKHRRFRKRIRITGNQLVRTPKDFVRAVRNALGCTSALNGTIVHFAAKYVDSRSNFSEELDMLFDLTGCHNGVLRFSSHPFRVELLTDTRSLPISRSLDARYLPTEFSEDHPSVKEVYAIFRAIIPREDEFEYIMTIAAGIILSGRCGGEKIFILYGTGEDGKTTLVNALTALANEARDVGYGTQGDPRIFQHEKRDASSHDEGSVHLYGGARIGSFPEPDGQHPYLLESAIKAKLNHSSTFVRAAFQSARSRQFRVVPFIQTNETLEFRGTVTEGGMRRVSCMLFSVKFKSEKEYEKYRGKEGFAKRDLRVAKAFVGGDPHAKSMREALLWILIAHYLPRFYDACGGDIYNVPLPQRFEKMNGTFFGRHHNTIDRFVSSRMVEGTKEDMIPITKFITEFTQWHRRTQRGTVDSSYLQRKEEGRGDSGPAVADRWTLDILHVLSSSPLGSYVVEMDEDKVIHYISVSEIPTCHPSQLFISEWKFKGDKSRDGSPNTSGWIPTDSSASSTHHST